VNIAYLCADGGIPVLGDKGASVHVREFISALHDLGHSVTLLCARRGEGNPSPPARLLELPPEASPAELSAEAVGLGLEPDGWDETLRRELERRVFDHHLARRAFEALSSAGVRPQALYERYSLFHRAGGKLATRLGVPYVLEVNAPLVVEQERFRGLRLKAQAQAAETAAFRRADHLVVVSEALREYVQAQGVSPERVSVLPNGVNLTQFHPEPKGLVRTRYGLGPRPVIGFVGSLKPWHGLDFLLEVFLRVRQQRPDAVLMVVGEGPGSASLAARIAQENLGQHVILTGRIPHADIPDYMAAMNLTVAPYTAQEGFYFSPLKVLESLAAGCPVVAPRLGQLSSLIQDGLTGLLFPPGDLEACAQQILTLLGDVPLQQTMGHQARLAALATLGWKHVANQVLETFALLQARSPQ